MEQTRRRGPEYDLLRRVSTAPAGWSIAEAASNPVTPSGTPRAGIRHPLGSPAIAKVPPGGYMPSPRRRGSIAGPGSLLRQSPRLARWTIEELPSGFENARRHREPPAATIDGAISSAHLHVEHMLAGKTPLEDFVALVEGAEKVERWALWTEISGRLQVAKSASRASAPEDTPRQFVDEPKWALNNDRILAQSIMRKPLLCSQEVQVTADDIEEAMNPFHLQGDTNGITRTQERSSPAVTSSEGQCKSPGQEQRRRLRSSGIKGSAVHVPHGHELQGENVASENKNVLQLKSDSMHLLHQLFGLSPRQTCIDLSRRLPAALQSELARVFIVDSASNSLSLYYEDGHGEGEERFTTEGAQASVAFETMRQKRYIHVPSVSTSKIVNPLVDLGPSESRQAKWTNSGQILGLPVANNTGDLEMVVIVGRVSAPFSQLEIQALSWIAVTLGNVLHHNKLLANSQQQIDLLDIIAENAMILGSKGCEVQDPRFWMAAFDAQVAQITLVHQDQASNVPLLYCNCCDTSKDEVSMTCYQLRGKHRDMVNHANGQPWWSEHAETEISLGLVDKDVDLGSSEWIGRTSVMLVPIMRKQAARVVMQSSEDMVIEVEEDGRFEEKVAAIIMVASTERVYGAAHRKMLMAMAGHLRLGVIHLLESWDRDVAGSYRDSFMLRDSIKLVGETASPLIPARQEARVSSANSELERETAEAVSKRERGRHFKSDPHKYYEYSKVGLERMLQIERSRAKEAHRTGQERGWK